MDKKTIVNDLYHASLISVFVIGYSMLGKKILHMAPLSIQKFDLEDTGKLVAILAASEMTRENLIKQKILPEPHQPLKMAIVAMLIRGAIANTLAFTGSSYLFSRLSANTIDTERKRHDLAIEQLQKAQTEWAHKRQERIDFIGKQLRLERKAETKFTELNDAMREYHEVFGQELPSLPRKPVLSDFYTPSDEQHYRELGFIALSMIGIGGVLYYFES